MKRTQRMIGWLRKQVPILGRFSEQRLLVRIQKGDKEAFGELYLCYLDTIYRYIFFRVNQEKTVAEDLTQTVFFKAWQKIDTFTTEKSNFRAWLYRIAHNTIIDYYKLTKSLIKYEETIADDKTTETLEEQMDNESAIAQVKQAMHVLTDDQKTVIVMKFIDGFSNEEIATIIDKNQDAIRALQYRGLERLRKELKKYEWWI